MNRRNFIAAGLSLSLAGMVSSPLLAKSKKEKATAKEKNKPNTIKPKRLKAGDKIGLIAPGWTITETNLKDSIEHLKLFGFEAVYTNRVLAKYGYLAGTDKERAADINEMFRNPEIDGIICVKGGYGCARMLDLLDYDAIRKNPKVLMGFSDVTALVNAIYQQTGLISFHGPVGTTIHRSYNAEMVRKVVMEPQSSLLIENAANDLERAATNSACERYTIVSGSATGELAGGNLSLISSMAGTNYEVDLEGKIVFIEEIGEEPYRIDRMLTQLIESGKLQKAAGIAFGICNDCDKNEKSQAPNSFTLREVVEERIKSLNIPAAYGLSFGHNINNMTVPVGLKARFNADNQTIELLENAVV